MSATTTPHARPAQLTRLLGYLASDPENLQLRADVFDLALTSGHFAIAQDQTSWVLGRTPVDFGWRHRLALLDMAQQEWDEAAFLLQGLINEGQSDPVIAHNLAHVDFSRGHYGAAVARLKPLLATHAAQLPDILTLLLRCLHRQGEIEEGLTQFSLHAERLITAETLGVASLLAIDASRFDDAKQWADQALARDPVQQEALVARGTASLGERDPTDASRFLTMALQRHPDDGRTLSALGMAELLRMNMPAAEQAFTRSVALMPSHIGTWLGLGWCQLFQRNLPAARYAFEAALALDDNFGESHGGLAVVQALQGDRATAEESIRRALGLEPTGLSARYAQAVLSGDAADPEKFARMAARVLGQRQSADGKSLADIVLAPRPVPNDRPTESGPTSA
jgi:Flp pilus assembly protein TadD